MDSDTILSKGSALRAVLTSSKDIERPSITLHFWLCLYHTSSFDDLRRDMKNWAASVTGPLLRVF
jgi:hypothetical protein